MKEFLSEAIGNKVQQSLERFAGADALFGQPVKMGGGEIIPVGKVIVRTGSQAEGEGGGDARLKQMAKGSGGGVAQASVQVEIVPVGFIKDGADGPVFVAIDGE
ncbi:MAG: hypothetical protein ACQES2_06490 [Pseudomonadota bacterium]